MPHMFLPRTTSKYPLLPHLDKWRKEKVEKQIKWLFFSQACLTHKHLLLTPWILDDPRIRCESNQQHGVIRSFCASRRIKHTTAIVTHGERIGIDRDIEWTVVDEGWSNVIIRQLLRFHIPRIAYSASNAIIVDRCSVWDRPRAITFTGTVRYLLLISDSFLLHVF